MSVKSVAMGGTMLHNIRQNQHKKIRYLLSFNYFLYAILLNSVGTVILKVMSQYHVTAAQASSLEAYKDISIALFSLCVAAYLVKFGYRRAMLVGLGLVCAICVATPLVNSFWMTKVLFMVIGISFVLIKMGTYATVSQITSNEKEHASFMSTIEGIFMLGWLAGYFIFGYFMAHEGEGSLTWLDTYWLLAIMSAISAVMLYYTPFSEPSQQKSVVDNHKWMEIIHLAKLPLVQIFIVCVFLYVFIEQGIATWLPSFNHHTLNLSEDLAVKMTAILAGASAVGRLVAGYYLREIDWMRFLSLSLFGASLIILFLPMLAQIDLAFNLFGHNIPWVAVTIPMVGFFLAPIYPTLCSTVLSSCPGHRQGALTALIIIFSALGGTLGSRITGILFGNLDGYTAITATFIPIMILFIALYPFKNLRKPKAFNP